MASRARSLNLAPTSALDAEANRQSKRFYDSVRWRRLRALVLAEQPLCLDCEEPAEMVHHLQERTQRPDLELDRANLVALCHACHARRHKGAQRDR